MNPLIEAWYIHNRINAFFIEAIADDVWNAKIDKGRAVSAQFGHIHQVRLMWLKSLNPIFVEGLEKFPDGIDRPTAIASLNESSQRIARVVAEALERGERVKGFKPTAESFLLYLISHESHHRGMVELGLRQAGHPISDKASFGLWEWGSRVSEV